MQETLAVSSPFSIRKSFGFAWNTLVKQFWFLLAINFFMTIVLRQIAYFCHGDVFRDVVDFALEALFMGGFLSILLSLVDGGKPRFADLFSKVRLFWRFLVPALCIYGSMFLGILLLFALALMHRYIAFCWLASILVVVAGIIVAIHACFYVLCITEEELAPITAFKRSSQLTRGCRWKLFGFYSLLLAIFITYSLFASSLIIGPLFLFHYDFDRLSFIQKNLLGLIFIFFLMPAPNFCELAWAHCYRQLSERYPKTAISACKTNKLSNAISEYAHANILNPIGQIFKTIGSKIFSIGIMGFAGLSIVALFLPGFTWMLETLFWMLKECHIINSSPPWVAALNAFSWGIIIFIFAILLVIMSVLSLSDVSKDSTEQKRHWYEYAWMSLPILLAFTLGLLGAGIGAAATYINGRIFKTGLPTFVKYLATGGISFGTIFAFCVFAMFMTDRAQTSARIWELIGNHKASIAGYTEVIKQERNKSLGKTPSSNLFVPSGYYLKNAYLHRGYGLKQLEDYKGAIADFTEAILLKPDDKTINNLAYEGRGEARKNLGDIEGAKSDFALTEQAAH